MASEDKDYKQSALGQRVNELMDDGYDFGEAVKQAMSEGLKDGGSVGIEILFGPKVPAAPSQLVSESDILLGFDGEFFNDPLFEWLALNSNGGDI